MSNTEKVKERIKLNDWNIKLAIDHADYSPVIRGGLPIPERLSEIDKIKGRAVAEAQIAKVLADPDVLIRDENQEPPSKSKYYDSLIDVRELATYHWAISDLKKDNWVRVETKEGK